MNGALTIGTLDGANVEIREQVGAENFFLFGLTVEEVTSLKQCGYNPYHYYDSQPVLRQVIDQIAGGAFSAGDQQLFRPIVDSLLHGDEYLVLADFQSYVDCQEGVSHAYQDQEHWTRMSILKHRTHGQVLLRPFDPRVRPRHLARPTHDAVEARGNWCWAGGDRP
jgi:starch phosphorylase